MFEKFTERARQVIVLAQDEARALGHPWIGTEHLLLGILREGGEASLALEAAGLTLDPAREAVTAINGSGEEYVRGQIPFTLAARQALEGSLRESVRFATGEITPSVILLGVLAVRSGSAACVLRNCGVDTDVALGALGIDAVGGDPTLYRPDADAQPEPHPSLGDRPTQPG